jgi:hypothetical protein
LQGIYSMHREGDVFDFFVQVKRIKSFSLPSGAVTVSPFSDLMDFTVGYKYFNVGSQVKTNLTFGLGLHLMMTDLDYAYESSEFPEFDGKHYFSLDIAL